MGHETSAVASTPVTGRDLVEIIELALSRHLPQCRPHVTALNDALRYSVFPGGKRLRPVLTVLGARIFEDRDCGSLDERVLRAACAVEFVHTSSLILDDMPCMDDAGLRRGNPALHLVYGEDAALLAGIQVSRTKFAIFALSGMVAAFAGIVSASRIVVASNNAGEKLRFEDVVRYEVDQPTATAACTPGRTWRHKLWFHLLTTLPPGGNVVIVSRTTKRGAGHDRRRRPEARPPDPERTLRGLGRVPEPQSAGQQQPALES